MTYISNSQLINTVSDRLLDREKANKIFGRGYYEAEKNRVKESSPVINSEMIDNIFDKEDSKMAACIKQGILEHFKNRNNKHISGSHGELNDLVRCISISVSNGSKNLSGIYKQYGKSTIKKESKLGFQLPNPEHNLIWGNFCDYILFSKKFPFTVVIKLNQGHFEDIQITSQEKSNTHDVINEQEITNLRLKLEEMGKRQQFGVIKFIIKEDLSIENVETTYRIKRQ